MSKQIKLLEEEPGFEIFLREGRNLARITPAGQQVIDRALRILQETQSIRTCRRTSATKGRGVCRSERPTRRRATCSPRLFSHLNLYQGTSEQIAEMVAEDRIDCAIATGAEHLFPDLTLLPCYR